MIVDLIKSVSDSMTPSNSLSWLFSDGELYELNEDGGAENFLRPFFMLVHPVVAKDEFGTYVDVTTFTLKIFLLQQSNLADKQSARNVILARMYSAKNELKAKLNALAEVDQVVGFVSQEVFNAFDNNFDGLELDVAIKFNPSAFCE